MAASSWRSDSQSAEAEQKFCVMSFAESDEITAPLHNAVTAFYKLRARELGVRIGLHEQPG
jgi:hypothetical protein